MKKVSRTSRSSSKQIQTGKTPPTWKKTLLSNSIALAVAGLGASSAFAACPGTVTGAETTVCNLTGTDSATINSGASIQVEGTRAIFVDGANTNVTITNAGTVSASASDVNAIYVDGGFNGTIINTGTILGDGTDSVAGIYVESDFAAGSTLTNSGTITGSAVGSESSPDATGIDFGRDLLGAMTNEAGGLISAVAEGSDASAIGINVDYTLASTGSITNHGTISATATASDSSASAYGIYIDDYLEGVINNTGTIAATATGATEAAAYGIYLSSTATAGSQITNSGTISATATTSDDLSGFAEAYGLYFSEGIEGGTLDNSGTISATATGADEASAYGIYVESTTEVGSRIANSGTISATASSEVSGSAYAYGLYFSEGFVGSTLDNSGTITVAANGVTEASAYGIYVSETNDADSVITNSGTISVNATASSDSTGSAQAYGFYFDDLFEGTMNTSGTITATATGPVAATAAGIYLESTMQTGSQLTNSGTVTANAATTVSGAAEARGIYIDAMAGTTFTNTATGVITANSTSLDGDGVATGLEVGDFQEPTPVVTETSVGDFAALSVVANSSIINQGTITAVAEGAAGVTGLHAFGMHIDSYVDDTYTIPTYPEVFATQALGASITSSGTISATATSTGSGPVEAYGIFVDDMLFANGPLDNSGTINASASGVVGGDTTSDGIRAAGIYVRSGMEAGSTLTNSGTLNATAAGPDAEASGIRVDSSTAGAILNSGDIAVTGGGGVGAHGILVNTALAATGSVENAGTISASGTGGDESGTAGIYIFSMESGATLSNSGTITASPVQGAFSLYVETGNGASISNSGRLDGGLYLGGASLSSTGTVAMPVGVTGFIGGDYIQSGSGVLEIGVMSSSAGGYGQLQVDGTADLTGSDRVAVNVSANEQLVDGETIQDVLSAGTLVTGAELTATDNSALWDFTALNDGTNNIDLGVIRGLFVADAVRLTGPEWALGAATSLDAIIDEGPQGDMETVIAEMGTLSTAEQVSQAAAQMVPVLVAQGAQMANLALNNITGATIDRNAARKGMAAGDELLSDQHVWIKPFGSAADQDERDGVPGYDIDNYGLIVGYDQAIDDAWTVGGAIGYSSADAKDDSDLVDHELDVESVQLAAYADWQIDQYTFVDLIGVVGSSDNDSKRVIRFAGIDRTADGSYDSWYGRLYSGVGRNFIHDKLTLTPVLSATYSYIEDDSYTETGAGSINLDVDSNDADSFIVGIDGRLAYALNDQNSLFTAHAGVGYDTISDTPALTSTFVGGGPAFVTEGAEPDQVVLQAGVGLEFHASEQVDIYINYEFEGREDFSNQLATATVRYAF